MAITLPAGFNITNKEPVDARFTVADQAARLAFSSANVYNGLLVFQRDTNELYVLKDTGSWNSNAGWELVGSGSGGSGIFVQTGSFFATTNDLQVTGSINASSITSSFKGDLEGTASVTTTAINADSASYVEVANRTSIWSVTAGGGVYKFEGNGLTGIENAPVLYLTRGEKYRFSVNASTHPFYIQTSAGNYSAGNVYSDGITNAGTQNGNVDWNVQFDAPTKLYYVCGVHPGMGNAIYIQDPTNATGSFSGSFTGDLTGTASVAINAISASYALSASVEIIKEVSSSYADTASYVETAQTASYVLNAVSSSYAITASYAISASHEIIKEVSSSYADTASYVAGANVDGIVESASIALTASLANIATTAATASNIVFNGNRKISNTSMPVGVFDVNYGGTDLKQFVENVFFVNSAPVVQDTASINIGEYEPIGTNVFVVTAIDAESQALTFATQSSYTDNYFGINSSTGQVTVNTKTTASMNTVTTGSEDKAPFPVRVTDTGGLFGERTYYIRIVPNTAPIWSLTSGGSELTPNYTGSLLEASSTGANKYQFWFRDTEGDTITIGTGSLNTDFTNYFSLNIQSNYVGLDQDNPLDFDTVPSMSFVLTASDQHYESGDDPSAITYLPVKIEVQDNAHPTIGIQSFSINEKSDNGATVGTISNVSDSEGNNVQIPTFTLVSAHLASAPGTNLTQSLVAGGQNSLQNPTADPFEVANQNTRVITRKSGVFLNADVADTYTYRAFATDQYQPSPSDSAIMTITVDDHAASTLNVNTPWYIVESARSGEYATDNTNGVPENLGEYANLTSAQSQRYTIVSTNNFIEGTVATGSATDLRLAIDLSGSGVTSGATINVQVTASQDDFDTTIQKQDYTISVVAMQPPDLAASDQSSNLNTNGARPSNNLVLISISSDPQGYNLDHSTWTFTPNVGQALEAVRNGVSNSYYVRPTSDLAAGTYGYTASISNDRGFTAGELKDEFTIVQAGVGTLTGDTTSYIIESSTGAGAQIKEDTDGRTGNQADLDVDYGGTGYNGAAVTTFASSNAFIGITNTGLLSVTGDVSGSYAFGDPAITSNITWQDQYGNIGGPTAITVNIAQNAAPSATIIPVSPTLNAPQNAGTKLADVSITDTESDTPYNLTLTGADAASLVAFPTNAASSSYEIRLANTEANGKTFTYNAVVKDNYGSTQTYSSQTLELSEAFPTMYIYTIDQSEYGTGQTYNNVLGIASEDGSTPPVATIQAAFGVLEAVKNNDVLGDATFIWQYGGDKTATRRGNPQAATVDLAISGSDFGPGSGNPTLRALLFVPSGSNVNQVPTSFVTSDPSSGNTTPGQYVMFISNENEFQNSSGGLSNKQT